MGDHVSDFPNNPDQFGEVFAENSVQNNVTGDTETELTPDAELVEDFLTPVPTPMPSVSSESVLPAGSGPSLPSACAASPTGGTAPPIARQTLPGDSLAATSPQSSARTTLVDESSEDFGLAGGSSMAPNQVTRPTTRLQSGIRKEKVYTDGTIKYGRNAFLTATGEPQCLEEAFSNKDWKEAMDAEYMALMKNKTWHLVPP